MMRTRLMEHVVELHARGIDKAVIYRAIHKKAGKDYAKRLLEAAGLPLTMSDLMRGRQLSESTRQKLREARIGQKASKETIAKMSAALKGRTITEETRAKISTKMQGHAVSQKTRKKIAASLRRYQARRKLSLRRWELRTASRLEAFKAN